MLSVFLVEPDIHISESLKVYLAKFGMNVVAVGDGNLMADDFERVVFDFAIIDLMLPGGNGLVLCRSLRQKSNIPILMLTSPGNTEDRIVALESGADDCIVKPFDLRELIARIQAILRRAKVGHENKKIRMHEDVAIFMSYQLNCVLRQLTLPDNSVVPLSKAEYCLLKVFIEHPQRVLTRDFLIDQAQGRVKDSLGRSMDLLVSRLRQKLGDNPRNTTLIKTIRGEGYLFDAKAQYDKCVHSAYDMGIVPVTAV